MLFYLLVISGCRLVPETYIRVLVNYTAALSGYKVVLAIFNVVLTSHWLVQNIVSAVKQTSFMKHSYEIYGYTIPKVGKEKNGDHYIYEFIEEENILIAIVADGVSGQPCDWFSSELTCQKLLEYFKSNMRTQDIKTRLLKSIFQVNEYVIRVEGPCHKIASTLSVIVWQTHTNYFTYANVGDSRIYSSFEGKLEQLTRDDSTIIKQPVIMQGGKQFIDRPVLTKVIGGSNLTFKLIRRELQEAETLILATDGFYEARKSIFNQTMTELSLQENLKEAFENIIRKFEILRGDDFTAITLRRSKTEI